MKNNSRTDTLSHSKSSQCPQHHCQKGLIPIQHKVFEDQVFIVSKYSYLGSFRQMVSDDDDDDDDILT